MVDPGLSRALAIAIALRFRWSNRGLVLDKLNCCSTVISLGSRKLDRLGPRKEVRIGLASMPDSLESLPGCIRLASPVMGS